MLEDSIYVDCPCCNTKLEVLRENGKVINQWKKKPAEKLPPGVDPIQAALLKMKAEKERLAKTLENVGEVVERQRKEALEKFEKEKERIIREGDNTPPPRPFDLD
jgi:hypothetical protein